MDKKISHAYLGLKRIHELLDTEVLISRQGVSEPDSDFIWAPTFMAPQSIVMLDGQLFLNLFLPEGSEEDQEKKIFLNRVGAKFQDGLWQVRKRTDQLKGSYGAPLQFTLSTFKTAVVDQVYIKNGRVYLHLLMNNAEFELYSRLTIRRQKEVPDLKIEHFKNYDGKSPAYLIPGMEEDLYFVTMKFGTGTHVFPTKEEDDQFFYVLANFVEGGVKTVGYSKEGIIPELLAADEVSSPAENIYTFKTNNRFILSLMKEVANQFVVVFGFYGALSDQCATLTAAIPRKQVKMFLRILSSISEETQECSPIVTEIISLNEFQE